MLHTQTGTECGSLGSSLLSISHTSAWLSGYQASWAPTAPRPRSPGSRARVLQIQEGLYDERQLRLDDVQVAGHGCGRRQGDSC